MGNPWLTVDSHMPYANAGSVDYKYPYETPTASVGGVSSTSNPWGIAIPTSCSTTVETTGDMVSDGLDAPGCRHISSSELAYMREYKGEGKNLFTLG